MLPMTSNGRAEADVHRCTATMGRPLTVVPMRTDSDDTDSDETDSDETDSDDAATSARIARACPAPHALSSVAAVIAAAANREGSRRTSLMVAASRP